MTESKLEIGLAAMGIPVDSRQLLQLHTYLEQLKKWNRVYNLTAITDPERMVSYHILDSLALLQQVPQGAACLDVGTGAGLPGIPLAILRPDTRWALLDSNGKKTRFVQQAVASCGLLNVKVVHSRVQDYHADSSIDVIVSRAYASLQDFVSSVQHLWQPDTRLITMKTELSDSELQAIDTQKLDLEIFRLQIPGIAEKRSLVTIQRQKT